jgi:hypothetical protein
MADYLDSLSDPDVFGGRNCGEFGKCVGWV